MVDLRWKIPKTVLENTAKILASKDSEVFVLWTAPIKMTNGKYQISRLIMPEQDSHKGFEGAYVHIKGRELSRIAFDNYKRKERSVIQIHTHPSVNVNMSRLDRQWEVVSQTGALSIIVPNYGKNGLGDFLGVNIYEKETKDWRLWEKDEFLTRFIMM